MKKYKVLTQSDKWFSGKVDPAALEKTLNALAAEGWRVVSMASSSREGFLSGGGKDELVILLEKDSEPAARPAAIKPPDSDVYQL